MATGRRRTRRRRRGRSRTAATPTFLPVIALLLVVVGLSVAAWRLVDTRQAVPAATSVAAHQTPPERQASASADATAAVKPTQSARAAAPAIPAPYDWAARPALIAHGMGCVGGINVTNSREAFEYNYRRGYRIFEADFLYTRDGVLVARHDWSPARFRRFGQKVPPGSVPTLKQFKAAKIGGRYTPMTATEVVGLLRRYPDAYLMTDIKLLTVSERAKALKQISKAIGEDESLRSRLIVQILEEADLAPTRALGVNNVLYSVHLLRTSTDRALDFCVSRGIRVVTFPSFLASSTYVARVKEHDLVSAAHTVNNAAEARALRRRGVTLIYSDGLKPPLK